MVMPLASFAERPPVSELLALFDSLIVKQGMTTSAGDATGDSIIDSSLIGAGASSFQNMIVVLYPGVPLQTDAKTVSSFDNTTGKITLSGAYKGIAAAIPAGVQYSIVAIVASVSGGVGLTVSESAQSGDKVMTGGYIAEYLNSGTSAWVFCGGNIDLSPMQAGDTIIIRIRTKQSALGSFTVLTETTYNDVAPADHPLVRLPVLANQYGLEIEMRQTVGAFRTIPCEFFEAF